MRKLKILGSSILLILTLLVTVTMNYFAGTETSTLAGESRGPASQMKRAFKSALSDAEKHLAARLALRGRNVASIGRPANEFENFRFGILEGKYHIAMKENTISQIAFVDNPNTEGRPTFVRDRAEFLVQNKKLFGLKDVKQKVKVDIEGVRIIETYRVSTARNDTDLIIKFTLDEMDRLIGIETQTVSGLKYF